MKIIDSEATFWGQSKGEKGEDGVLDFRSESGQFIGSRGRAECTS